MMELRNIKVEVTPMYFTLPNGREEGVIRVSVDYKGKVIQSQQHLYHSDSISVLDHCFEVAKHEIKGIIEKDEGK